MTKEHTPSPWLIHGGMLGHRGDIFSPTAAYIKDCHHIARCFAPKPEKPVICELQAVQIEREAIAVIEANARLIAAAPELLANLEFAVKLLSACPAMGGTAQVEAMRAVIAKAKGEAS